MSTSGHKSWTPNRGRLALVAPSLRGGGAERVVVDLARGLSARGHDVDLVLARAEGVFLADVPPEVEVVDLQAARVAAALPGLVTYLRGRRPTAVLATMAHVNIVAVVARDFARVRTRLLVREANTISDSAANSKNRRGRHMPRLMRYAYPRANAIIAPSQGVAADLAALLRLPTEAIEVIPNPTLTQEMLARASEPVDHTWFGPGSPPVIVAAGRLSAQKDFATLIRAFALVRGSCPARLVILGEGDERAALLALSTELGVREFVDLPGFQPNPFAFMKKASVFVLSSAWEGLPNVLIQAMALGVPVAATDCRSGPREILEGGRLGPLVPVGEAQRLADAILGCLRDPVPADVLRHASLRYDAKSVVERYATLMLGARDA